jgi:transcriptional regulator with XRE-family HTH domain
MTPTVRALVARNLRWLKADRDIPWYEIADKVGVDQRTVYRWARGNYAKPDDKNLQKLAKTFGVTAGWMLEDHKETRRA